MTADPGPPRSLAYALFVLALWSIVVGLGLALAAVALWRAILG